MRVIVIALVAAAFGICQAQTVKQANALCVLDEVDNSIRMSFRLAMNGEPQGVLYPIDRDDFAQTVEVYTTLSGCAASYNSVNGVYTIDSAISTVGGQNTNPCGVRVIVNPPGNVDPVYYEWLLLQMDDEDGLLDVNDRVYRVTCVPSNSLSNIVHTNINVLTPNMNGNVEYLNLNVIYEVLVYDGTGDVNDVANYGVQSTANAGDWAKLRLTYRRGSNYNPNTHPFGAWCKNTYAGPLANLNQAAANDFLMDIYGCPYAGNTSRQAQPSNKIPPYVVESEYVGSVKAGGTEYHVVSGKFRLWRYTQANTNIVYFTTTFTFFDSSRQNDLDNSCEWYGARFRRRRSDNQPADNEGVASVQINIVVDDMRNQNSADASSDRQVAIIVGAVSGAAVLMLIAGCICLGILLFGKRRRSTKRSEESRTSSTISIVPQKA